MTLWLIALISIILLAGTTAGVVVVRKRRAATKERAYQAMLDSLAPPVHVAELPGTELGTHFEREALGNGRYRLTQHMKPIASYKNGSLRRDPGVLSATGAADWPLGVDGICDVRVAPRIAGKSPLLHMGHGKDFVRFALVGANNVSGVSKGNVTTFTNAWNGADLRYTYGGHRLQEDFLLRTKHPRSFGFILREHTGFDPISMTVGDIRILDPVLEPPSGSDKLAVPLRWIVTQQGGYWVLTVTLPAGDWAGWTVDPTLTLQPDETDGVDTQIVSTAANTNYATLTTMHTGAYYSENNRALVRFDLTLLPSAAAVSSATLTLFHLAEAATADSTIGVYRQLRAWTEAGATWNKYDGASNWGAAGGFAVTDCEQTDIGTKALSSTESVGAKDISLTPTSKAALDNGHGWMLKMSVENMDKHQWLTSDHTTASYRPKLVIDYTLPGGGGIFGSSIFHSAIHGQNLTR